MLQTIGPNNNRATGASVVFNGPLDFDYLVRLADAGAVPMALRTTSDDGSSFGIVMFEAGDETTVRRLMGYESPVRAAVIRAVLFPLLVATWLVRGPQAD